MKIFIRIAANNQQKRKEWQKTNKNSSQIPVPMKFPKQPDDHFQKLKVKKPCLVLQNIYEREEWFQSLSDSWQYRIFHWASEGCRYPARIPSVQLSVPVLFQTTQQWVYFHHRGWGWASYQRLLSSPFQQQDKQCCPL